jgi:transcriptional regulator of arginine metabolism
MPDNGRTMLDSPVKLNIVPVIQEVIEAKGMLIIKTLPGNANNTALFIDNAGRYEIAGTIAGDDTILLIPRDGISSHQLHSCLEIILPGLHAQIGKK